MRKLMLAVVAMFAMAGLVVAAEVMVTKVDPEKKEVTVKDGDATKTYTYSDKTKFTATDAKGENGKEMKLEDFEKGASKIGKKGLKVEVETEKDKLTEVKWKMGGKKKN